MKNQLLHFSIILIISTLLGYLSHDLIKGIINGTLIGVGFVGAELVSKIVGKR